MTLEELKGFLKRTFPTYREEKKNAITVTASDLASKSKLEQFDEADAERKNYAYPKFYGLDEFSRKFPKEALQTHGIKAKQIEKLCREEVYEITFNSFLSNAYFSEEERKKAKEQFLEYEVFKNAINAYTKNVVILRNISIKVEIAHNKTQKSETNDCSHGYTKTVTYKLSGSTLKQEQKRLNKRLKEFGLSKRGRAAIILMLLFDQKIPQPQSEYRVQWISNKTANAYNPETNRINLNFGIFTITRYICYRFFPHSKTFDDYQREFEEEFLEKMDSTAFDDCQLKFGEKFFKKTDHEETEEYYENDASSYDMGDSSCEIEDMDEEEVHNDKSNTESDFRFCFILRKPRELVTLKEAVEYLEKNKKSETHDGIVAKIEYSTDEHGRKIPTVIESTDIDMGKICYELNFLCPPDPKPEKTTPEKVAKVLETEDLRERNLTDEEFKLLENSSVHEITFNSILESGCFSEEQKSKAKTWLEKTADLEWAIYEYLKKCTFVELIDITLKDSETGETWYSGEQVLKEPDNLSEKNRDWLEHLLTEGVIQTETGAEKMILLLLFDEITPPEYRLSWALPQDKESNSYYYSWNIIYLGSSEETTFQDSILHVLHEIGHYLHWQIGFFLDFKGWENPFAKKLLLLESEYKKNKQNISLPQSLSGRFAFRKWGETGNPGTQNDLFMRWQMFSRWKDADELLNILGITFGQDGKTIYLDALSEVRAMEKNIPYGHNPPIEYEEYKNQFKTQDEQAIFEKIVQEAGDRKPDPEALNLLRKLHNLAPEIEVVNLFDANHPEYSSCTRDRGS